MSRFLSQISALVLVLLAGSEVSLSPLAAAEPQRPNIVLLMADDMGYSDLGCYGGEIDTPHLDRLAARGLRFRQFYNNAKCTETRAALLSGLYHHQTANLRRGNHLTLAEALGAHGYRTMLAGKWHLPATPPQRGFDRYFGFLGGAVNFFTGQDFGSGKNLMRLDDAPYQPPADFYTTDAFTDYALQFIDEAVARQQPFFLYLAHNAPHFPLHARPEDIEKYRGKYSLGWDRLRELRYARQQELGVIDASVCRLTPRDAVVPAWHTLTAEEQRDEDLLMAVYAAMVDRLDQNIGRLLQSLDDHAIAENTLVMFLSDNGGCPYRFNRTPELAPGPAKSYRSYDSEWANASNTPFRLYKQWSHEGGVATPLIVRWPAAINDRGAWRDQVGHLIDIMPTMLEIAGASYPKTHQGKQLLPLEGVSLRPAFAGNPLNRENPIFWEFRGNRAVREGRWKLVAERSQSWELYDMQTDRSELHNLAAAQPQRVARMAELYDGWAKRVGAMPGSQAEAMEPSRQPR